MLRYGNISLMNIIAQFPENWNFENSDYVRVEMPTKADFEIQMQDKGFYWVDRTLKVSIGLAKLPENLEKYLRLPIEETTDYKNDILKIAVASFTYDRRFHIFPKCNKEISTQVLQSWINELDKVLICLYKDQAIGFLALSETSEDTLFVHLAAVDEKYRLMGAGMALYAKACLLARERGYKKLEGRISSQNTAVMNVYARLGANFSEPKDIYLKEVK